MFSTLAIGYPSALNGGLRFSSSIAPVNEQFSRTAPRRTRARSSSANRMFPSTRRLLHQVDDSLAWDRKPAYKRFSTRDDLIDSVLFTRTPEYQRLPGSFEVTNWDDRRFNGKIDCDEVYPGIYLCNGETVRDVNYLKSLGVTHVLNTAEHHVPLNWSNFSINNMKYYGFHVDDHPSANISRYFNQCANYIDQCLSQGGRVAVNCVMGWSRSATVVAAYLMLKRGMSATQAVETIKRRRAIRPNPGFLEQLSQFDKVVRGREWF